MQQTLFDSCEQPRASGSASNPERPPCRPVKFLKPRTCTTQAPRRYCAPHVRASLRPCCALAAVRYSATCDRAHPETLVPMQCPALRARASAPFGPVPACERLTHASGLPEPATPCTTELAVETCGKMGARVFISSLSPTLFPAPPLASTPARPARTLHPMGTCTQHPMIDPPSRNPPTHRSYPIPLTTMFNLSKPCQSMSPLSTPCRVRSPPISQRPMFWIGNNLMPIETQRASGSAGLPL